VSPVAGVPDASAFFFLAAANAGVNARQAINIRIAVKDAGRVPRNVIDLSCSKTSDAIEPCVQLQADFLVKKRTIDVRITAPRMAMIMV